MSEDNSYRKTNIARALVDSEGWTRQATDSYRGRFIHPEEILVYGDVCALCAVYGVVMSGLKRVCATG